MRIIHLISGGDIGGAKTHVISLVAELSKEIDIELVAFRSGQFEKDAKDAGINVTVYGKGLFFGQLLKVIKKVRSTEYDVIHCHGSKANLMGMFIKILRSGSRVVTTIHSDYKKDYLGLPIKQYTYGILNATALRFVDEYIVVHDTMAKILIERDFDPNAILHIFNGMKFDVEPILELNRKEYFSDLGVDYEQGDLVIGIAGRLTAVKDMKTLIQGFAIATQKHHNLKLVIAGDGEEKEMLLGLAKKLKVADKIFFVGWISDMKKFYAAIDINTLTSISEGFPYVLLEGANGRCATITSNVGVAEVLIKDGQDGFIFDIGNFNELAKYIEILANDPRKRADFGQAFFESVSDSFSLEKMKDVQIEIYKRIIKRSNRTGRQGVCISGAYGRGNAGDDAILEAIIAELHSIDKDLPICVLSKNPKGTRMKNRVDSVFTFNIFSFFNRLRKTKLFISGGGNLIQDVTSNRSLYFYLFTIACAKRFKNKVMMYGCGVGPITRNFNIKIAAYFLNKSVDIITLREKNSSVLLSEIGVDKPKIVLSADPAINIGMPSENAIKDAFDAEGIPVIGNYLCVSVRNWKAFDEVAIKIAVAISYAKSEYGLTPVLLPIELPKDASAIDKVVKHLKFDDYYVIKNRYNSAITVGIISKMRVMLAMRLHAIVFAANTGIHTIAVSYDPKVKGFMEYMGQNLYMDIEETDEVLLKKYIDEVMVLSSNEENIEQVLRLKEIEGVNVEIARELLEG